LLGNGLASYTPRVFLLSRQWWQFVQFAGLIGFWLAVAAAGMGLLALLAATRTGEPRFRAVGVIVLSAIALGFAGLGVWLCQQPAYFLSGSWQPPPTTAELDALSPEAVVRTYFTARNLSVEYWLSDDAGRAFYHEPNAVPDLSLLAGVSDLHIEPLNVANDATFRNDATHRSFSVRYTSHASDNVGNPPGPQQVVVTLVRRPGGPWRVSYWGLGV
jgi:hypothetical protein